MPDTPSTTHDVRPEIPPSASFQTRRIGVEAHASSRHRGAPIDLDLRDADLANVFRLIADVGHVNIVVAGEVTGTITVKLRHVPWEEALEAIARAKKLGIERDGDVIVVRADLGPRRP